MPSDNPQLEKQVLWAAALRRPGSCIRTAMLALLIAACGLPFVGVDADAANATDRVAAAKTAAKPKAAVKSKAAAEPLEAKVVERFHDGRARRVEHYRDGTKIDVTHYYPNGKPQHMMRYTNDERVALVVAYWESGIRRESYRLVDGVDARPFHGNASRSRRAPATVCRSRLGAFARPLRP